MPVVIPAIAAAVGSAASAGINAATASGQQSAQQKAQAAAQQQAQLAAQGALNTNQATSANLEVGQLAGYGNALASSGLQAQNNLGDLYGQYGQIAAGQGPNPAQAMLAQQTGANVANQAALMAGQRGAGANVGLMARQAAQQGASTQQQAVGQGATLQAQQSLSAMGQQAGIAQQQQANALAAQQAGAQAALQNQQITAGILTGAGQQGTQLANTGLQTQAASNQALAGSIGQTVQGGIGGLGSALAAGSAPSAASANPVVQGPLRANGQFAEGGPVSSLGQYFHDVKMAKGGKVPALVSPGERYLPPKAVKEVVKGHKSPMKAGEKIPGHPKVGGAVNSYANDVVHKTLQEGGIVLPRSVTQAKDKEKAAKEFIVKTLREKFAKKSRK